jgi:hypothetical protein
VWGTRLDNLTFATRGEKKITFELKAMGFSK